VIISNCVINLSGDKRRVLSEAFRVLKTGWTVRGVGRRRPRRDPRGRQAELELWVGCVAGALREDEFLTLLADVGFVDASVEPTRIYELDADTVARELSGRIMSAFVRARKPERR